MSPSDKARRIRVYARKDGKPVAPVDGFAITLYGDEKVKLVVVRGPQPGMCPGTWVSIPKLVETFGKAGMYIDAYVLHMPHGAEFEVWEEP